ncbi:putative membrane protein [Mycobacterium sp. MAC_080597_8934]|nr:putative membrane protein [Mycobacterium sp. MAC_011194_8550]ETZ74836.1 putative membrane protein [Mycobacterium sp. MAC_080597_8934]
MNKVTKILFTLVLAFAVSTTSVSCVPPYCPLTGAPAAIC